MSRCDKKDEANRVEDISHGIYEAFFLADLYDPHKDPPPYGIRKDHIQGILHTFLNHIVHDPSKRNGKRFSCDVDGSTSSWKSCKSSRVASKRMSAATEWMPIAIVLSGDKDADTTCDTLLMADAVVPFHVY